MHIKRDIYTLCSQTIFATVNLNRSSGNSLQVRPVQLNIRTNAIPSIMETKGMGTLPAVVTPFTSSCKSFDFLVYISSPLLVANVQGTGPSG